jgi:large subunit ribosomal protein L20
MPRSTPHKARMKRRKKLSQQSKGFRGSKSKLYKSMKEAVARSLSYAYRDRRNKKRDLRRLWIVRISAACKQLGGSYSTFIDSLKKQNIILDRKILAQIAAEDTETFNAIYKKAVS